MNLFISHILGNLVVTILEAGSRDCLLAADAAGLGGRDDGGDRCGAVECLHVRGQRQLEGPALGLELGGGCGTE